MNTALRIEESNAVTCVNSLVKSASITPEEFKKSVKAIGGKTRSRSAKWDQIVQKNLSKKVDWPESL